MAQFISKKPPGPALAARCGSRDAGCASGHCRRRAGGREKLAGLVSANAFEPFNFAAAFDGKTGYVKCRSPRT